MLEIKDILNLIGGELKDDSNAVARFREFIEKEKWTTDIAIAYSDEYGH